jgi:hypothetical protein
VSDDAIVNLLEIEDSVDARVPGMEGRFSVRCLSERVEYFFYCRDRPDTAALRDELVEAHWSFMDRYADAMIARGPTLTPSA